MDKTLEVDNLDAVPMELLQKALDAKKDAAAEEKRRNNKFKREETKRLKEQQLKDRAIEHGEIGEDEKEPPRKRGRRPSTKLKVDDDNDEQTNHVTKVTKFKITNFSCSFDINEL